MAIATFDQYIASSKQMVLQGKTASITAVAQQLTSVSHLAGSAGTYALAGTDATVGVLLTDAMTGFPALNFSSGTGYISRLNGYGSVSGRIILVDYLMKFGTIAYNGTASGLTTVGISGRVPSGDYTGCELWLEAVTAFTGNQTIVVTYLDGTGASQTTGSIATGVAPIIGRCYRMPLANGTGIGSITGYTSSISTAGTFNLIIVRRLAEVRIPFAGYSEQRDLYGTGMPIVFPGSALAVFSQPDSTASGLPEFDIEIASA